MRILALDVDGVLLDPHRGGLGNWTVEMEDAFGITRLQIREAFFAKSFDDILDGHRSVESGVSEALSVIGADVAVEDFLTVWFEADFVPIDDAIAWAGRAHDAGCRVVLSTNQEYRRAGFLRERLGAMMTIDDVLYSADLGVQKHHAAFFELASVRLGLGLEQRNDVVFVDDVEYYVMEARAAGWRAVHAAPGADWVSEAERLLGL